MLQKALKLPKVVTLFNKIKDSLVLSSSALEIELKVILSTRGRASLQDILEL